MNLSRRIWLTGASSGIGLELTRLLLAEGHCLALSARRAEPLLAFARRYPGRVLALPGDLTDSEQVRAIGAAIESHWGALDSVILNAGSCEYIDARHFEAALLQRVVQTNLLSAGHCIEAALPLLRQGVRPHLVGIGSSVTWLPLPRAGAYGASKAALRYLLESLRLD
ncbi:MAG TPA: short-chain dehydrogenase, partial [Pseudomonas sp.]|nr:short-chain dehydrogenase [Pseudomonas sp.]